MFTAGLLRKNKAPKKKKKRSDQPVVEIREYDQSLLRNEDDIDTELYTFSKFASLKFDLILFLITLIGMCFMSVGFIYTWAGTCTLHIVVTREMLKMDSKRK